MKNSLPKIPPFYVKLGLYYCEFYIKLFLENFKMRRSQAPSLKSNFNLSTTTVNKDINTCNKKTAVSNDKIVRSTENVLDLILNSDCISSEFEENKPLSNHTKKQCLKKNINVEYEEKNQERSTEVPNAQNKNSEAHKVVYNVVYGKQTKKKHKTWEGDGVLEIGSKYLTLKDEEGKVLGVVPCPKARKLEEGERICIGSKEVELIELARENVDSGATKIEVSPINSVKNDTSVKPIFLTKKFVCPKISYSSGIALPEPSAQHQWNFNQKNVQITPVYIEGSLSNKLREHQILGIKFLYECIMGFKEISLTGAILADEMGLGKTLQCISLIWTLLKQGPYGNQPVIRKVLIVTPSSLTMNWHNEFLKWLGRAKLVPFVVNQKNKPNNMRGPVMIISYEMLVRYYEDVEKHEFDLLVCDEGHRLKNSNIRTTQILNHLNCSKRILLTGTPIQNDLQEFYALVDFVNPNVLGSPSEFRRRFEDPILASRQPDACEEVLNMGKECAQELKRITSQFLLRRTRDILSNYLPQRHEVIVFCKITEVQRKLYNSSIDSFIGSKENILGLSDGFAPLELITILRKICSHPNLYQRSDCKQFDLNGITEARNVPSIEVSSKVAVTIRFLQELQQTSPKEKVVLVSNSTRTLDLLEKILESIPYITCRLDGSTPAAQRNDIVERFNLSYSKAFIFLLSAKAGGVGLNLTGASRLILFDSDWNPATDLQAIGRIWRDGQKYPVYIYRLLTTGTIEEKIYQRQISKQGLCEGTIDPENANSIKLSKEDLKDIFVSCSETDDCLTHDALSCDCSKQGEIPVPELEPEERSCQLIKQSKSSLKIYELLHWEHHGRPFESEFLSQLCLKNSKKDITFIFRCSKN